MKETEDQDIQTRRGLTGEEIKFYEQETSCMLEEHLNAKEIRQRLIDQGAPEDFVEYTVPYVIKQRRRRERAAILNPICTFLFILGIGLSFGNQLGIFPTFPYAGFLTMSLGFAIWSLFVYDT
jgi:hypothetical protein